MDEAVVRDIEDARISTTINVELALLVDQGLLEMGITPEGEALFWPTPRGAIELGMELDGTTEKPVSA